MAGRAGLGPIVDVVRPVDTAEVADPALVLWYDRPATLWMNQALPIGNGEIGGMVFGGTVIDHIQFNEKTLWEGGTQSFGAYQTFGDIWITVPGAETVTGYRLQLDIENALASVAYTIGADAFRREYFVSHPDKVMVVRLTGPAEGVNADFALARPPQQAAVIDGTTATIVIAGKLTTVAYEAQLASRAQGGQTTATATGLSVRGADAVTRSALRRHQLRSQPGVGELRARGSPRPRHRRDGRGRRQELPGAAQRAHRRLPGALQPRRARHRPGPPDGADEHAAGRLHAARAGPGSAVFPVRSLPADRLVARGRRRPRTCRGSGTTATTPPWNCDYHSNINVQMNLLAGRGHAARRVPRVADRIHRRSSSRPGRRRRQAGRARLDAAHREQPVRDGQLEREPPRQRLVRDAPVGPLRLRPGRQLPADPGLPADEDGGGVLARSPDRRPERRHAGGAGRVVARTGRLGGRRLVRAAADLGAVHHARCAPPRSWTSTPSSARR